MLKRKLRIVRRVRNVPVLGICETCNAEFSGDPLSGNSQSVIQKLFNAHTCQRTVASSTMPAGKEASKSK